MATLKERVRKLKALGLPTELIAERLGCHPSTAFRYASDKAHASYLARLQERRARKQTEVT